MGIKNGIATPDVFARCDHVVMRAMFVAAHHPDGLNNVLVLVALDAAAVHCVEQGIEHFFPDLKPEWINGPDETAAWVAPDVIAPPNTKRRWSELGCSTRGRILYVGGQGELVATFADIPHRFIGDASARNILQ